MHTMRMNSVSLNVSDLRMRTVISKDVLGLIYTHHHM